MTNQQMRGLRKRLWEFIKSDRAYLWLAILFGIPYSVLWIFTFLIDILPKFGIQFSQKCIDIFAAVQQITASALPVVLLGGFAVLWKFMDKQLENVDQEAKSFREQTDKIRSEVYKIQELSEQVSQKINEIDQSKIRLLNDTTSTLAEAAKLFQEASKAMFVGYVDEEFMNLFEKKPSTCKLEIYDTGTVKAIQNEPLVEKLIKHDATDHMEYNYCLYKQLIGFLSGTISGRERQLLFFKDSVKNETVGVIINDNFKIEINHLKGDWAKGVAPQVDFNGQAKHIRGAVVETLNYWKPMVTHGWVHPVFPPVVDQSVKEWGDQILQWFSRVAKQIAEESTTIRITWRIVLESNRQAEDIKTWLNYLKDEFVNKGKVERYILVDYKAYRDDTKYKKMVDDIVLAYFPLDHPNYTVKYADFTREEIPTDGFDFAIFEKDGQIIAVQGSTYERGGKLLRIFFDRSAEKIKAYQEKFVQINQIFEVVNNLDEIPETKGRNS